MSHYHQCDYINCPKCGSYFGWNCPQRPQTKQDLRQYAPMSMVGSWFIFYVPIYVYVDRNWMIRTVKDAEYVGMTEGERTAYCQNCQHAIRIHPVVWKNGNWVRV